MSLEEIYNSTVLVDLHILQWRKKICQRRMSIAQDSYFCNDDIYYISCKQNVNNIEYI